MKPLKIAAQGFAGVLAVLVAALAFGVPALTKLAQDQVEGAALAIGVPALTKLAQDQVEGHSTYRFRVDGPTTLSLHPSPTLTLRKVNLVDVSGNPMAPSITAERVRISLSLASLVSGRPEVNEVAVMKPYVRAPIIRQGERRGAGSTARAGNDSAPAAAIPAFTLDRFIVEDGTLVMSNTQDRFESRIDRINLTGSLSAEDGRIDIRAHVDDQPIHLQVKAKTPLEALNGRSVPIESSFEAPGMLEDTITAIADVRLGATALMINGVAGTIGPSKLNGWTSVDFSSKPLIKADFDVQRLGISKPRPVSGIVASTPGAGGTRPEAATWKSEDLRLIGLNYVDADVQFSAAELDVGSLRVAPVALHATLANGVLNAEMLRNGLYGGQVDATALVDVSGDTPKYAFRVDLSGVRALPLLSDTADFGALDGQMRAKIDVRATGASERAVMSSVSGTADLRIQDGQIIGINVPKMIRTLTAGVLTGTAGVLTGWQESRTESIDLRDLSVSFRIENGRATAPNLRLLGPLVQINGSGTVDIANQTMQFKLDPKLVASLEGQGGAADPLGFGVSVNVEGSWSDPRIHADVAGILSDPDGAYTKLDALGQRLFGKGYQGGGLDTLVQGLGTFLGPRNEGRDGRGNVVKRNDRVSSGSSAPVNDFLRDLLVDRRIHPDVAGIVSDPDGAYSKLDALGQRLFGKGYQGGGLDTLVQGLGTFLGPRNDGRDGRGNAGKRNDRDSSGSNAPVNDLLSSERRDYRCSSWDSEGCRGSDR
jgi:AsmA protein